MNRIIFSLLVLLFPFLQAFPQKVSPESIPPDLNCDGCITIVIKNEQSKNLRAKDLDRLNGLLQTKLIGVYKGQTVFTSPTDLDTNSLFKNENVYRYILNIKMEPLNVSHTDDWGNGRTNTHEVRMDFINFQFYDRKEKKGYPDMFERLKSWPDMIEKVAKALNDKIKAK